ncbi:MAG: hypothetical protein ABSD57_03205 [Verrucomicrobiota bacterium]|jgi:hypothetical protein
MKLIARLALVALLPSLSGCLSMKATQAANKHTVEITLYNSVDRIEKAAVTKDDQLCVFFEKDLTNSPQKSHFSLILPLAQIQTNAQYHDVIVSSDDNGATYVFPKTLKSPDRHTWWTLQVPGGQIRTNWTLLKIPNSDLKYIPVATALTHWERYRRPLQNPTVLHDKDFILLSNATQTVYLTRTTPIEFVYVDASTNRSFTIVSVNPTVVSKTHTEHPGYYFLLPLTVPVDIATSPFQAIGLLLVAAAFSHGM